VSGFDGLGPLLDSDGPWETAQYVGPGACTDPVDPLGLMDLVAKLHALRWDLTPPACPGSSCLLHGTEHQHTGRRR
jgi:hypothetical protein